MRSPAVLTALAIAALLLAMTSVSAKKPVDPGPEPDPDPAIAFTRFVKVGKQYVGQLVVMNADGSNLTVVTEGANKCDWSPDGSRLAFFGPDEDGQMWLWTVQVDGTDLQQVTEVMASISPPAWCPATEGDTAGLIAYIDGEESVHASNVYVVPADGSADPWRLTDTDDLEERYPTWSPDGRRLACTCTAIGDMGTSTWGLYDFDAEDGSEYSVQTLAGLPEGATIANPSWSKTDESRIAWRVTLPGELPDIWIADPDEIDDPYPLTDTSDYLEDFPSWSPDDSQMVIWSQKQKGQGLSGVVLEVLTVDDPTDREAIAEQQGLPVWRR